MNDGPSYRTLTCGSCGAPFEISPQVRSVQCSYCGALNERESSSAASTPRAVVTFVSVQHSFHQQYTVNVDTTDDLATQLRELSPRSVVGLVLGALLIATLFATGGIIAAVALDAPLAMAVVFVVLGVLFGVRWAMWRVRRIAQAQSSRGAGEES